MKSLMSMFFVAALLAPAGAVVAGGGEGHSCSKEAHAGAEKSHDCHQRCDHAESLADAQKVELTGKLLCRHCNLHETSTCEKVFVTESDDRFSLCPHSDLESLQELSDHGAATLVVSGVVMAHDEHDDPVLMAESARLAE